MEDSIEHQQDLFEATLFINGLRKARRGVVLVESEDRSTTAWLITDNLVVVPSFFLENQPTLTYRCYHQPDGPQPIEAQLVASVSAGQLAGLLRINRPIRDSALALATDQLRLGDAIIALQHPERRRISFSIGDLVGSEENELEYTAATTPDSAGSPLLNAYWAVVGMHEGKRLQPHTVNRGVTIPAILQSLHNSPAWEEIMEFHRLVDLTRLTDPVVEESAPAPEATLLRATLRWQFAPAQFTPDEQRLLKPLVLRSAAPHWSLSAEERRRALAAASSWNQLREARGTDTSEHPGQQAIDYLLQGPPYRLGDVAESVLPYLLQVVRWFEAFSSNVPSPQDINLTLERRRIRSRLQSLAGPSFRGREVELRHLADWYAAEAAGPLVLTGLGGVGKSALLARFVIELPDETLLLWLDFDRPDLAPDNAVSMLTLLTQQLQLQRPSFPDFQPDLHEWQPAADRFARELAIGLQPTERPLLVLDGFEVAQYAASYNEVWKLLEVLLGAAPRLRVIISGRTEVLRLNLLQRPAQLLSLRAMNPADVLAWLLEYGIRSTELQQQVLRVTQGIPLLLRLILPLLTQEDGTLVALPDDLPAQLMQGVLYQRILHRLADHVLLPLVQDALVLRVVTEELLAEVLGDRLPDGLSASEGFRRLSRELSIVSEESGATGYALIPETPVLYVRPDVRRVVLWLLEAQDPSRVRILHQRATRWYRQRSATIPAYAAEAIYHSLLAGDLVEAGQLWQNRHARLLQVALPDFESIVGSLPDREPARQWLQKRIDRALQPEASRPDREEQLLTDISRMIARGDTTLAYRYLRSHSAIQPSTSTSSPLILMEAWLVSRNDLTQGRKLLGSLSAVGTPAERDQALLGAYLASQANLPNEAQRLLALLNAAPQVWNKVPYASLARLAVRAAQLRLATDIPAESQLTQQLTSIGMRRLHRSELTPADVVLPSLVWRLQEDFIQESSVRYSHLPTSSKGVWKVVPPAPATPHPIKSNETVTYLRNLGKWRRQAGEVWMFSVIEWQQLFTTDSFQQPLATAIISTLTAFRGQTFNCTAWQQEFRSIDRLVHYYVKRLSALPASQRPIRQAASALAVLQNELAYFRQANVNFGWLQRMSNISPSEVPYSRSSEQFLPELQQFAARYPDQPEFTAIILYLLGPDPLEILCRLALELPAHLAL